MAVASGLSIEWLQYSFRVTNLRILCVVSDCTKQTEMGSGGLHFRTFHTKSHENRSIGWLVLSFETR